MSIGKPIFVLLGRMNHFYDIYYETNVQWILVAIHVSEMLLYKYAKFGTKAWKSRIVYDKKSFTVQFTPIPYLQNRFYGTNLYGTYCKIVKPSPIQIL